jgi:hypothetical protein
MPQIRSKSTRPDTPSISLQKVTGLNSSTHAYKQREVSPGLLPPEETPAEKQMFDILFHNSPIPYHVGGKSPL